MLVSPFTIAADRLTGQNEYITDPVGWIEDRLDEHLWSKQVAICNSVATHRYTAVPSCYGTGKSFSAARLVAWWIDAHPVGQAVAVTTAPTHHQVRAILWKEIRRAHKGGKLRGRTNQTEWLIGEELVSFGRKPADYDPAAFQGIHAPYVLVVFDEAAGIPTTLWDASKGLMTNEDARMLAIGNPDDPLSDFANICKPGSGWNVVSIAASDTPAFTGELVPDLVLRQLVSKIWVEERAHEWGVDDPRYISKVEGRFPEDDEHGVVPWSAIKKCQVEKDWKPEQLLPVELGVDVGAGGDLSVIYQRRGPVATLHSRHNTRDAMELAGHVLKAIDECKPSSVKLDVIGWGWGVVGRLSELRAQGRHKADIVPVNVGEASTDPVKFPRLRHQIWWEVGRQLSVDGGWDLTALDDKAVGELIAVRWKPDSSGRVVIESKDETRKRLGRSPDDADALLLAFYTGGEVLASEPAKPEGDPYAAERRSSIWN